MTSPHPRNSARLEVQLVRGFSPEREHVERELTDLGISLPVPQRALWQKADGVSDGLLIVLRSGELKAVWATGVEVAWSRALPGHRLYRIRRYGAGPSPAADAEMLRAIARYVRQDPLCLRAVIEIFDRDADARQRFGKELRAHGFSRSMAPRMYEQTFALDLQRTEAELFGMIDKTARRHVRAPVKKGYELRTVTEQRFAPRIAELMVESFKRTNATAPAQPWARIIDLSTRNDDLSRVVGIFDPAVPGPESLVSVAWGCAHGSYASYEAGAVARNADTSRTPLSYAPLWDLITWATRKKVRWFDLGGVSTAGTDDSRAGITRFKRYFSDNLIDVGEEWHLEPHRARAAVARSVASAARWIKGVARL
jgi:hypothetical protein